MTTIKIKTKTTGEIVSMQVQELMEVNGEPYTGRDSLEEFVRGLSERVVALEAAVFAEQPAEVPA